jgi:trimethylamine:corrinoid methyltransferase-like protein
MSKTIQLRIPRDRPGEMLTLGDEERQQIAQAAFVVLERVGVRIEGEESLRLLERAGGGVDHSAGVVRFAEGEVLDTARQLARDWPADRELDPPPFEPSTGYVVGNGGSLWFDWERWDTVAATRRDLRNLTRWAEGMDGVSGSNQFCIVQEKGLDPVLQLVDAFAIMFQHSTKPVFFAQPTEPIHVKYLNRLVALQRQRGYSQLIAPNEHVNLPLTLSDRAIRGMLARIDAGMDSICMGAMTTAGVNAPLTAPGFATMATAEVLGALCVVHRLRPQVGLMAALTGGVLDMRSGGVSYQCPWAVAAHYLAVDVFRHVFGARLHYYWGYRNANEPGMQACYEWGTLNMFHRCFAGQGATEVGGLADGNIFSPEQAVMDIAMEEDAGQILGSFEFSPEAIGLDLMLEAGHDVKAYLTHPHTLAHCRSVPPFSDYWLRGAPAASQHSPGRSQTRRLMDRAHEACLDARQRGEQVQTDQPLADEAWAIVREMAEELGVPAPEPLID